MLCLHSVIRTVALLIMRIQEIGYRDRLLTLSSVKPGDGSIGASSALFNGSLIDHGFHAVRYTNGYAVRIYILIFRTENPDGYHSRTLKLLKDKLWVLSGTGACLLCDITWHFNHTQRMMTLLIKEGIHEGEYSHDAYICS